MFSFDALVLTPSLGDPLAKRVPALLWPVLGRPLLGHVLASARAAGARGLSLVAGPEARDLDPLAREHAVELLRVAEAEREGDGAVSLSFLRAALELSRAETVLAMDGAMPLLRPGSLRQLVEIHAHERAAATRLLAVAPRPDARVGCVCVLERASVLRALEAHAARRPDGDLGDVFVALVESGRVVATTAADEPAELSLIGGATGVALAGAELRARRNAELLASGVLIDDPASTWVDVEARVEPGARLRPGCLLEGRTRVACGAVIGPFARLVDVEVGADAVVLDHCLLLSSAVEESATLGPFAHVRPGSRVRRGAKVGNFVELKNTDLGEGSKAPHLSYLGDARIGARVNVGAGTITCNYDGVHKHETRIEDGAFIGSDATLVAPLVVGAGAYVGAGSTLTHDVPPDALAVARARQVTKAGWAARRRAAGAAGKP